MLPSVLLHVVVPPSPLDSTAHTTAAHSTFDDVRDTLSFINHIDDARGSQLA
jgi:hypothetical protein